MKNLVPVTLLLAFLASCTQSPNQETPNEEIEEGGEYVEYNNPPAEGFNQEGSDLLATLLADKVMNAMGGRKAWDETRYLSWNFFGSRIHVWDKQEGNVRIEQPSRDLIILMNINSQEGKVMMAGEEMTNPDSLSKYLDIGNKMWINDAYWLVMPYKLKDSGVTLTYVGEDTTELGAKSDVIRLSFDNVGVTPENVYDVWVDVDSKLVTQWSYYKSLDDAEPRFITPWEDYQQYGSILLSGGRGGERRLSDIQVLEEVPEGTFDSFDPQVQ